jgi:hypothetical protein
VGHATAEKDDADAAHPFLESLLDVGIKARPVSDDSNQQPAHEHEVGVFFTFFVPVFISSILFSPFQMHS